MTIRQFEDRHLSHFSYALLNGEKKELILVDPARDVQPYVDFATASQAGIIAVIETHPHADFASGHLELHQRFGAKIYSSGGTGALYPHARFDEPMAIEWGEITLRALHTPGHSPDSLCILALEKNKQVAVFTGDTLFIGDCGRPDLREGVGNTRGKREELARMMFHSLRNKLVPLSDDVIVYPAHGAGSLCGKNLSKAGSSTIGEEKKTNWCLQDMPEEEFVRELLTDQPFIPKYFAYDVALNMEGAPPLEQALEQVPKVSPEEDLLPDLWVVDTRTASEFRKVHHPHSLNLGEKGKFETWLGSIIQPGEKFYLVSEDEPQRERMMRRVASIGYEPHLQSSLIAGKGTEQSPEMPLEDFEKNPEDYTIVDVRNRNETKNGLFFSHAIPIPLGELRERVGEIPLDKPVVVHCAGGYRSAVGSSLISAVVKNLKVYDLGEEVKKFQLAH